MRTATTSTPRRGSGPRASGNGVAEQFGGLFGGEPFRPGGAGRRHESGRGEPGVEDGAVVGDRGEAGGNGTGGARGGGRFTHASNASRCAWHLPNRPAVRNIVAPGPHHRGAPPPPRGGRGQPRPTERCPHRADPRPALPARRRTGRRRGAGRDGAAGGGPARRGRGARSGQDGVAALTAPGSAAAASRTPGRRRAASTAAPATTPRTAHSGHNAPGAVS